MIADVGSDDLRILVIFGATAAVAAMLPCRGRTTSNDQLCARTASRCWHRRSRPSTPTRSSTSGGSHLAARRRGARSPAPVARRSARRRGLRAAGRIDRRWPHDDRRLHHQRRLSARVDLVRRWHLRHRGRRLDGDRPAARRDRRSPRSTMRSPLPTPPGVPRQRREPSRSAAVDARRPRVDLAGTDLAVRGAGRSRAVFRLANPNNTRFARSSSRRRRTTRRSRRPQRCRCISRVPRRATGTSTWTPTA